MQKIRFSFIRKFLMYIPLTALLLLASCTNPPEYPNEPEIEYIGLNKNTIVQGNANTPSDTLAIRFSFTDGDGNLGDRDSINIFLTDSRTGGQQVFRIEPIPEEGAANGIRGEITLRLPNRIYICCTFPNSTQTCVPSEEFPIDTMSYAIQIRDRDGNMSNKIQTETFTILCD